MDEARKEFWTTVAYLIGKEDPYYSRRNYEILLFWNKEDFPISIHFRFYITAALAGFFLKRSSVFTYIFMTTFKAGYIGYDVPSKVVGVIKGNIDITYNEEWPWSYSAELL